MRSTFRERKAAREAEAKARHVASGIGVIIAGIVLSAAIASFAGAESKAESGKIMQVIATIRNRNEFLRGI